jgi:drug/metabolite transporter (DMT)-like permease
MGDGLALAALALFSVNTFVVQAAAARVPHGLGFLVVLAATVVFGGSVAAVELAVRGLPVRPSWQAVSLFLLAGILSSYLGRKGYYRSVETMGPSRAAAVQVTNPAFALVFAWIILGERLRPLGVAAMALVVTGLFLTTRVRKAGTAPARRRAMSSLPLVVVAPAVFAAVCYGLGNVARGAAVDEWREPIIGGLLGAMSGTGAYLLFHVPLPKLVAQISEADRRGLALWSLVGALTIAGQTAVIGATMYIPIAVAVAISSALPVLVIPASVLLFGNREQVTPWTVVGAALIVVGVVVLLLAQVGT